MRILVVEDEPKVLELFTAHFQSQGHQVATSDTGEGALEALQRNPPDLLLADVLLKGKVDGLEVLRQAKQANPGVKVVVITGSDEVSRDDITRLGAAFLKKPIRLEELDQLIARL
jgi:DNA-binding response OmpR family regulator